MKDELSMEQILDSVPANAHLYKGDSDKFKYSIKNCKDFVECVKHYIPNLCVSDRLLRIMIGQNFRGIKKADLPEFELTDRQAFDVTQKRIDHFMRNRQGLVFEHPRIYRQGVLTLGYKVTYNEQSKSENAPKTTFDLKTFNGSTVIEGHKDIPYDDVLISGIAKTLTGKFGEVYKIFYSLYYVNMFTDFSKLKKQIAYGHQNGLQRKLKLIGKEAEDSFATLTNGIAGFNYHALKTVEPKDYGKED